jgi:ribosomal protein S18 acetylase RimI-like enzyme
MDVLVEAFLDDPVVCWLFPALDERRDLQRHFYRPLLGHPGAEAYLAGGGSGAALWLALTADEAAHQEAPGGPSRFGASGPRLRALGEALAERHPGDAPHLYLPCMGVLPGRRGAGLGSALLRHRLARADADGLGTYLEASSPRSRSLYRRHGFEDLGAPVRVADGPPLWPMWRPPSTPTLEGAPR